MTYRVCRKFTSSTFQVDGHLCKVFLEPLFEFRPGFYLWNVGFAVGKSQRQLNDWYRKRKNKRARSLINQLTGRSGLKTISAGFQAVRELRWNLAAGDGMRLDCTSKDPERQFRAWKRWARTSQEWVIDEERREFVWYRPPYWNDPIRDYFDVMPITPKDKQAVTWGENYSACFLVRPKGSGKFRSMAEIIDRLNQAPET